MISRKTAPTNANREIIQEADNPSEIVDCMARNGALLRATIAEFLVLYNPQIVGMTIAFLMTTPRLRRAERSHPPDCGRSITSKPQPDGGRTVRPPETQASHPDRRHGSSSQGGANRTEAHAIKAFVTDTLLHRNTHMEPSDIVVLTYHRKQRSLLLDMKRELVAMSRATDATYVFGKTTQPALTGFYKQLISWAVSVGAINCFC